MTDLTLQDIIEALVDCDRLFQENKQPSNNGRYSQCQTFSEQNVFLGTEGIVEGEEATPDFVYVTSNGYVRFRFKSPEGMGYDSFDAATPEKMFWDVIQPIESHIIRNYELSLNELRGQVSARLTNKPQLIASVNEQIAHARRMRLCAVLEEEAEGRDGFYERQENFGQF